MAIKNMFNFRRLIKQIFRRKPKQVPAAPYYEIIKEQNARFLQEEAAKFRSKERKRVADVLAEVRADVAEPAVVDNSTTDEPHSTQLCGLQNFTGTCYANAAIQSLASITAGSLKCNHSKYQ